MNVLIEKEIDFPLTVSVLRPKAVYSENGDYVESFDTVIPAMTADIQLSLKVRNLVTETKTGSSDNAVWTMFANPPVKILDGDRVSDGERNFIVEAVGEWGSHTECIMRKI
jgi:hypothetical protein